MSTYKLVSPKVLLQLLTIGYTGTSETTIPYMRLLAYITNNAARDVDTPEYALVPSAVVQMVSDSFIANGTEWLKEFAAHCGTHVRLFEVLTDGAANKCNAVHTGFISHITVNRKSWLLAEAIKYEWITVDYSEVTPPNRSPVNEKVGSGTTDQKELRSYLASVPDKHFELSLEQRKQAVLCIEQRLSDTLANFGSNNNIELSQVMAQHDNELLQLQKCIMSPPCYMISVKTRRLHDSSWQTLPSSIKSIVLPGHLQMDLQSSYLAIFERVASKAGVSTPLLTQCLRSQDPWKEIIDSISEDIANGTACWGGGRGSSIKGNTYHMPRTPSVSRGILKRVCTAKVATGVATGLLGRIGDVNVLKPAIKAACYKELFGMGRRNIRNNLLDFGFDVHGVTLSKDQAHAIHFSRFMLELEQAGKALCSRSHRYNKFTSYNGIIVTKGIVDVDAEDQHLSKAERPESLLHRVCSGYEQRVMRAAVAGVRSIPGAFVSLLVHDAIYVGADSTVSLESAISAAQSRVARACRDLGIKSKLVLKI